MLGRIIAGFSLLTSVLCLASQAVADVAPPTTYVEECTIEKKLTQTTECIQCRDSHHPDYAGRCTSLLAPFCYTKMCDAWGGTAYQQVWCRITSGDNPTVPESITSQLAGYLPPNLDNVAGAANCPSAPVPAGTGGATSNTQPTNATGGATSNTQPTNATGGATSNTQPTNPTNGDGGCSVPRAPTGSGATLLGLLGLLGVILVSKRRVR